MFNRVRYLAPALALVGACFGPKLPATSEGSSSSATTSTTSTPSTASTATSTASTATPEPTISSTSMATSSSGTTGSTTSDTADAPDPVCCDKDGCIGPVGEDCTVWEQDCPEGQKCVPVPECDLGWWTAEKCILIVEDPAQLGEDCIRLGGGVDNCIKGAYCWHMTLEHPGTCVPLCHDQNSPICDDAELQCVVDSGDSTLGWCLAACDPLIDSCPGSDEKCAFPPNAANFICWPIFPPEGEEPGAVHTPCDNDEACDKGLVCINNPLAAEECDPNASSCCEPYCDLTHPDPQCPGVGQKCIPLFNDGEAPPGQENVGVCAVPF